MSVLEFIGIIAAVGFGAAGFVFGWRADQRAKAAEQIARYSNRIADDSNRIALEAVEIQRDAVNDGRTAKIRIRPSWPLEFTEQFAYAPFRIVNDGQAHARQTRASVTQAGAHPSSIYRVFTVAPYSEQEVEATLHFDEPIGSHVQTDFLFRYHYSDGLPDAHTIEHCYHLEGLLGSDAGYDWKLTDLIPCPYDDGS